MAGLREIARLCGVSTSTVSDILNRGREDRYRPETRDRVLAAIQELGYQPDRTAQSMRARRTKVVGFVAANLTAEGRMENAGVYPFLVGLSHGLTLHGYHAALVELAEIEPEEGEDGLPSALQERFFDALVLQDGLSEAAVRLTKRMAVPVLNWDSDADEPTNCLRRDEKTVTREAMERLLALGHRRIGYLVGEERWQRYQAGISGDHYSYADRYETYSAAMGAQGRKPLPLSGYSPDLLGAQIRLAKPTAVIAPEVDGARTVVDAALSLGWRVPEQLTVVALDREARGRELGRKIGGISYDRVAVGRQAARMVREILEGGGSTASCSSPFGEWREGDTVGPPPPLAEEIKELKQ